MFKKLFTKLKNRPILTGVITLALVIIVIFILTREGSKEETITITRGDFVSQVSASGKVVAAQSSRLGFDQSGRVSGVYAKVGDSVTAGTLLASIENGSARADAAQKQATLEREQAKLAAARRGTRPEQLALTQQKYADASSALLIAIKDASLKTESALLNNADTLFENGNSVNPTLIVRTDSQNEKRAIEIERLTVGEKILAWKSAITTLSPSSPPATISSVRLTGTAAVSATTAFLGRLGRITANLSTGNAGLTQSQIDAYRATVNAADQAVSAAASSEQTTYAAWTVASNNLALEKSGSTPEDITAQEAQVKAAEADLANAQAQVKKTLVIAPFDGIVTQMDAKVGEISSPNVSVIALIGTGLYEIESYIPEVSIARLSVGNPAVITLDAYGSDVEFAAKVIAIDPAETVRDGVSTYKTRLQFSENDPRIKPGMTANIRITTERKSGAIIVPKGVITEKDGVKTIRVIIGETIHDVTVETGSITPLGQVEIVSGLSEGDQIVLPALVK